MLFMFKHPFEPEDIFQIADSKPIGTARLDNFVVLSWSCLFIFKKASILLTSSTALAIALAAQRYQRSDLYRRRSMVLAHP